MAYQYSPGRCCCGCDFLDDFDFEQSGYTVGTISGAPTKSVSDGMLHLAGGSAGISKLIRFNAAEAEDEDSPGGYSLGAIVGGGTGKTGVYISGGWAFVADFAAERFVTYPVSGNGGQFGTLQNVGTDSPSVGDSIELRHVYSPLLESWVIRLYVNGIFQMSPGALVAPDYLVRVGMVGDAGSSWDRFQIDCSVTGSSVRFCFDVEPQEIITVPHFTPFGSNPPIPGYGWNNGTATPPPTVTHAWPSTNWIVAKSFGIVIPEEATNWGVGLHVRYGFIKGGPNTGIYWRGYTGSGMVPGNDSLNLTILQTFGNATTWGPLDLPGPINPAPLYDPAMTMDERRAFVQTPEFGFGIRWRAAFDVAGAPSMQQILHTVYRMWLTVCYTIDT